MNTSLAITRSDQLWKSISRFMDELELGLPNTNNALEGLFSDLKTKVRVHSGISRDHRRKLLDEYIKRNY